MPPKCFEHVLRVVGILLEECPLFVDHITTLSTQVIR
jgi:hypothetical protein